MNREEAIDILFGCIEAHSEEENEALDMAIEALERERTDEWCDDCKEYDTEKKCCPRFNKVIREALKREPSDDGTLEVKVEDATKVGRVLISDGRHRGGLYYPDEDEPKGDDLISRAEAIETIELVDWYHQNSNKDMVHGANDDEHQAWYKADDVCKALEAVPSADRPRGEWKYHEDYKLDGECCYECSNCGRMYDYKMNYCGYCGADMRETKGEA